MTAPSMAFLLRCDVPACGAEIESGEGQPTLQAKRSIYCQRCAGLVAGVEAEVRRQAVHMALEGQQTIEKLRKDLMAKMMPPQLGGNGQGTSDWPTVG